VIIVTGTNAFKNASLIMFQKIINFFAVISLLASLTTLGSAYFAYKFITSPKGQEKIKNIIVDNLKENMPNLIDKQIPKFTQPAIPSKPKTSVNL
tara:strand:+ start:334 stop:618 length:285 start_codon:yes stop_codon:yes gene_type:complete